MGVCGAECPKKNEKDNQLKTDNEPKQKPTKQKLKKQKNQVIISVKYNDNEPVELLLDKKQKISDLINELKLGSRYDYDFYDSNQILINDKINQPKENIFDIKYTIAINIKRYSLKLSKK